MAPTHPEFFSWRDDRREVLLRRILIEPRADRIPFADVDARQTRFFRRSGQHVDPTLASESAWASRETHTWRDRDLPVVSRAGLILLKRFRSSDQDLVDIARLEEE